LSEDTSEEIDAEEEDDEEELEPIGSLIDTPMPRLVMQIHKAGLSGTLYLEGSAVKTWVHFTAGCPDGVHDPNSEVFLGMVLREQGVLSDEAFNASLMKMAETGQLQGQVLIDMGAITKEQLERALRTQQVRKASQLFGLASATYRFEQDAQPPARIMAQPVSPYTVVYHGIHNRYTQEDLDAHLAALAGKLCGAGPNLRDFLQAVELPEDERADLDLLSQHRSPDDFANRASAGRTTAQMLLLTLYWSDLLVITDPASLKAPEPAEGPARPKPAAKVPQAPARPVSPPQPKPKPKPGANQLPKAMQDRLDAKYKQAERGNLLALLELRPDAGPDQVKTAFAGLAKIFHPDRFARFEDAHITKQVELIAARLNEAFEVLTDPARRQAHLDSLIGGESRPKSISPEAADKAYQKAKVYMQKKDLAQALTSMRLASKLNPGDFTYRARLAWLEYAVEPAPGAEHMSKLKRTLLALRKQAPSNFWVNRLLAIACQLLDEPDQYAHYLEKACGIRPKDVDSARELRLVQMRKGKAAGRESKGGLFGRRKD